MQRKEPAKFYRCFAGQRCGRHRHSLTNAKISRTCRTYYVLLYILCLCATFHFEIQGHPSGCSLGFVDIKTKVVLYINIILILKCNFCFFVLMSTKPREQPDGSPCRSALCTWWMKTFRDSPSDLAVRLLVLGVMPRPRDFTGARAGFLLSRVNKTSNF